MNLTQKILDAHLLSGKLIPGNGKAAALFLEKGYKVFNEEEINLLESALIDKDGSNR
ncbi:MAG: hypothetical protein IJ128_00500 [Firmicutes bacterium]|nr:hypothetical protein [Bacillota bacterium]